MYSLWWIEQHIKDLKKQKKRFYMSQYNNCKGYVKFVQTAAKKAKVPVVEYGFDVLDKLR